MDAHTALALAKQRLADLEEEARRARLASKQTPDRARWARRRPAAADPGRWSL